MLPHITKTIILSLFLLTSCSQNKKLNSKSSTINWEKIKAWSIQGKISIKSDSQNGSGRLTWDNNNNLITAKFTAPLGQGSWEISETPNQTILTSSHSGEIVANKTEELIQMELGWNFPWSQLNDWIRGYKTKNETKKNELQSSFFEDGWQLEYKYKQFKNYGQLPRLIIANKPPYQVKVAIYTWALK